MTKVKYLIEGPVKPGFVSEKIAEHQDKTSIGAHAFFLGQVRADKVGENETLGIEYSAYEDMVEKVVKEIKDDLFSRFNDLICLHIWHSVGLVKAGEISLFVIVSSGHRKQAFAAVEECVEQIKEKLPVWKKELFDDGGHVWN
jgi:molybdopterin synthase catalytic subunit